METNFEEMFRGSGEEIDAYLNQFQAGSEIKFDKFQELRNYKGPDRVLPADELKRLMGERKATPVQTLLPALNEALDGFTFGELIVISGPTGHGKTTFAQTLTQHFVSSGHKSLWFSFEVPFAQFIQKFSIVPEFYSPAQLRNRSLGWIETRIFESLAKYRTRIVFIDHLHFLIDMSRLRNPSLEIGSVLRELKTFAVQNNLIIFLIAHLSKITTDTEPDVEHLRDSSFIGQEADSVLILWRTKDKETKEFGTQAVAKVAKARRTGTMGKKIKLEFSDGIFIEDVFK